MFHDRVLLQALLRDLDVECPADPPRDLRGRVAEAIHPLGRAGLRLPSARADELARTFLGGAGAVMRSGERAALGPARAGQTVLVHVTTPCMVTLELWLPFATMPCGRWQVRGPGSSRLGLVPNEPLAEPGLVGPDDFGVVAALGNEGEFPAWITFGP